MVFKGIRTSILSPRYNTTQQRTVHRQQTVMMNGNEFRQAQMESLRIRVSRDHEMPHNFRICRFPRSILIHFRKQFTFLTYLFTLGARFFKLSTTTRVNHRAQLNKTKTLKTKTPVVYVK